MSNITKTEQSHITHQRTQIQRNSISNQNRSLTSDVDDHLNKHKGKYGLVIAVLLWICTPILAMLVIFGFGYFTKSNADKIRNNKRRTT